MSEGLTLTVGKQSWTWELRPYFGAGAIEMMNPNYLNGAFVLDVTPLGWHFHYQFNPDIAVSFGWGKVYEGSYPGNNSNDLDLYFLRYDHMLGENSSMFVALVSATWTTWTHSRAM
ncbi:MAG: hypothetical protein U5N86_13685 [Planctomycetota bacterium]|nr:hypothetical protein [Planctomycetota bacterium]